MFTLTSVILTLQAQQNLKQTALENVNSEATSNDQKIRKWAVLPESFTVKGGELGKKILTV